MRLLWNEDDYENGLWLWLWLWLMLRAHSIFDFVKRNMVSFP